MLQSKGTALVANLNTGGTTGTIGIMQLHVETNAGARHRR